jgi:hypothetical protein
LAGNACAGARIGAAVVSAKCRFGAGWLSHTMSPAKPSAAPPASIASLALEKPAGPSATWRKGLPHSGQTNGCPAMTRTTVRIWPIEQ